MDRVAHLPEKRSNLVTQESATFPAQTIANPCVALDAALVDVPKHSTELGVQIFLVSLRFDKVSFCTVPGRVQLPSLSRKMVEPGDRKISHFFSREMWCKVFAGPAPVTSHLVSKTSICRLEKTFFVSLE